MSPANTRRLFRRALANVLDFRASHDQLRIQAAQILAAAWSPLSRVRAQFLQSAAAALHHQLQRIESILESFGQDDPLAVDRIDWPRVAHTIKPLNP